MNLFLASSIKMTVDALIAEYRLDPATTKTAYIPTAENCFIPKPSLQERGSYECLVKRGFPLVVLNLEEEHTESLKSKLADVRLVVCGGGNTYFLLHHMRASGFTKLIPELLHRGVIYAGSSAGSVVCSSSIAYVKDQDDPKMAPELTDYTGLGLVDFEIHPHCIEEYYAQNYTQTYLKDALLSPAKKFFLRDHQAVVVRDEWYKVVTGNSVE